METPGPIEAQKQSPPPHQASLLGLPRELRDKIYRYLFKPENGYLQPFHHRNWGGMKRWPIQRIEIDILCASKQLCAEAQQILYDENTFASTPNFLKGEKRKAALARVKTIKISLYFFLGKVDITNVIEFLAHYPEMEPFEWSLRAFAHGPLDSRGQLGISEISGRIMLCSVFNNARGFLYLCRKTKEEVRIKPGERYVMEGLKRWVNLRARPMEFQHVAAVSWDEFKRKSLPARELGLITEV